MPDVARWINDIAQFIPFVLVQIVRNDAFERLGLRRMLLEPEFLFGVEADIDLVANLRSRCAT